MTVPPNRSQPPRRPGRRFRDLATLLPLLGLILLVTPVVSIFTQSGLLFGLPAPIVFVFGVWAGLIILAFALARRANKAQN